jgi:hypothetical protein
MTLVVCFRRLLKAVFSILSCILAIPLLFLTFHAIGCDIDIYYSVSHHSKKTFSFRCNILHGACVLKTNKQTNKHLQMPYSAPNKFSNMKTIIFSLLFFFGITAGANAQAVPAYKSISDIFRIIHKPAYRKVYAKIIEAANKAEQQGKKAVKMPQFIYTLKWDEATKTWTDSLAKYEILWDNNQNLQTIVATNWDTTGGNEISRSTETGFIKVKTPEAIDNNLSLDYYPTTAVNESLSNGKWVNTDKQILTMDKGLITSVLTQQWSKKAWADDMKVDFTYDNLGNFTGIFLYSKVGATWALSQAIKESFVFNKDGFITDLYQIISVGGLDYTTVKEKFTLDNKGAITNALILYKDTATSTWVKYDSFSNITWLKFDPRMSIDYSSGGQTGILPVGGPKHAGYTENKYDTATKSWSLGEKHTLMYNADSLPVSVLVQTENNKTWENYTSDTTTYYPGGDTKTFLSRYWSSGWHNTGISKNNLNNYDGDNDIKESILQNIDPSTSATFKNYSKTTYQYVHTSGIYEANTNNNTVKLYPNPASDRLNILFAAQPGANYQITISDIAGKTIQAMDYTCNDGAISMEVSSLKTGIYLLTLSNGQTINNYKFIKN